MEDLNSMTHRNIPDNPEDVITTPPAVPPDPMADIARATGLHIPPEEIASRLQSDGEEAPVDPVADVVPVSTPGGSGVDMLAEAAGEPPVGEALDPMTMGIKQEQARYAQMQQDKRNGMEHMFQELEQQEKERLDRMEKKTEEIRASAQIKELSTTDRAKQSRDSGNPDIDDIDLTPGYTEEDMSEVKADEITEQSDVKATDDPPNPEDKEYGEYIRNLPIGPLTDIDGDDSPKTIIRVPQKPTIITKKSDKTQTLGDQAFMNAINRFKRDSFGKSVAPLVNSGFCADVVGTGVVDMQNLYMNVRSNTTMYDYQLEQMRVVIKNVVGTSHPIPPASLAQMIHYADFEILSYAHVCATLETVESVTNCKDCGLAFRIETDPVQLIMNADEIDERRIRIMGAKRIEDNSLMTSVKELTATNGIKVVLGHPSYSEYIRNLRGFQAAAAEMTEEQARRFETMLNTLHFIRHIELPTGTRTNNIRQVYIAIGMLSDVDFDAVSREITDMRKSILIPQYGIRETRCPHCGSINKNIPFNGLLDLLFLHTTLSSFLNNPES